MKHFPLKKLNRPIISIAFISFAAKDRDAPQKSSSSSFTVSKASNQPTASIIRKPPPMNPKRSDPTNDAVAAINKNKALTVTARSVATTVAPVAATASPSSSTSKASSIAAGVNNTFTLSPIPSNRHAAGNTVTITPQPAQANTTATSTQKNTLSKVSPVPIALSKASLNQTTITKSPTPGARPNGTKSLSITPLKPGKSTNTMSPLSVNSRQIVNQKSNNNPGAQPQILVSTQTSQSKPAFKPIVAQTKVQRVANANVVVKTKPMILAPKSTAKANQLIVNKLSSLGVEMRKRPANAPISSITAKKHKPASNSSTVS